MIADFVLIAGLLAALAATLAWLVMIATGLRQADDMRFLPRGAWMLLCIFSPVVAVIYLIACLAWRHRPGHRA